MPAPAERNASLTIAGCPAPVEGVHTEETDHGDARFEDVD
jgi:hypothetical protein